jgi:hypothetical protein
LDFEFCGVLFNIIKRKIRQSMQKNKKQKVRIKIKNAIAKTDKYKPKNTKNFIQKAELKKSFQHFALNRAKKGPFCAISERSFIRGNKNQAEFAV